MMIQDYFTVPANLLAADEKVMALIQPRLREIECLEQANQLKMLKAFTDCKVAATHLTGSTGYGYDDGGRAKLEQVFAQVTGAEAALVRHNFMSGTHALSVALFGVLRPGDTILCASGRPYDTLIGVLGIDGSRNEGSLADFGVEYEQVDMLPDGLDIQAIRGQAAQAKVLYLQRSRGYSLRRPLTLQDIEAAAAAAREVNPDIIVMVDNCYGEFTQPTEPVAHGADVMVGSLIKNPGGGIAPTGGYIAGKAALVEQCAHRLTAPGVGNEIGSVPGDVMRQMYLGLYYAPGVTAAALKTGVYAAALFEELGCEALPPWQHQRNDIITSVVTNGPERLKALCGGIQSMSPVDSYAAPEPAPMPGYDCDIIMAAGAFTQGSSIELSCDGPMRAPYIGYLQGGLNFASSRAAVLLAAGRMLDAPMG